MNKQEIVDVTDELGFAVKNLIAMTHAIAGQTLDHETLSDALAFTTNKINELYERLDDAVYLNSSEDGSSSLHVMTVDEIPGPFCDF